MGPTTPRDTWAAAAATPAVPADVVGTGAAPLPRRRAEVGLALAGLAVGGVILGGFSLVMNRIDERDFRETLYPEMEAAGFDLSVAGDPYEVARTFGAWFGLTLLVLLAVCAVGILLARRRPRRRSTGWVFAAAGLVCLVGSQFVLYPVAFLFFLGAGLFALRRIDPLPAGSTP